jgi:hypothetical protein
VIQENSGDAAVNVLAVDPGSTQSALVWYDGVRPRDGVIVPNDEAKRVIYRAATTSGGLHENAPTMCVEQVESFGMAVGREVFETVWWSGRFAEAWERGMLRADRMPRREVKLHLCGNSRAKDANIRQALIDKFGGSKAEAIGLKASPGPLYGIKADLWAALAVAVTWWETRRHAP